MLRSRVTKVLLAIVFLAVSQMTIGQEKVEMADGMRSSGKIYVVVAVLAIIFSGLLIFLIHIDRKVSKLEKESQKSKL